MPPSRLPPPSRSEAEAIAVAALAYLAGDAERLGRFLAVTGLAPANIRAAAAEPGFLAAVLDHLAGDESLLIAFADSRAQDPARIAAARAVLAGAER